ncbi:WXG100 family type VII secretion target [Candidatus Mycolicibacterium alkanivorans]|uniref:WXG100 family type VII secretion target n=1 Tax=Candidatus Mycolicibacterium alkanivorans TaxID=2954114 RepID=A0ABS9YWQ7_9MYCO|nr:WXG100 family type VII secretion target [Candidatus Mycolicibacterium alkanivorans]MCI4675630.1 WXG100 family type VII secretion target [Candidatus Mycolicibacterium alkanivorans]
MALRANPQDLLAAGVVVTGHGEDVAAKHAAADNRVEAAQSGWQGQSAVAMVAKSQAWAATTTALLTRLSDHAQGLHTTAQCFHEMETANARALGAVGQAADAVAGQTAR